MTGETTLAICVRHGIAALALIEGQHISGIYRRHFFFTPPHLTRAEHLAVLIKRLKQRHGIGRLVVEPDSLGHAAAHELGITPTVTTLAEAKEKLLGATCPTHADLLQHLVSRFPELTRYVKLLHSGRVATSDDERFRTTNLLAAALGLATLPNQQQ